MANTARSMASENNQDFTQLTEEYGPFMLAGAMFLVGYIAASGSLPRFGTFGGRLFNNIGTYLIGQAVSSLREVRLG